MRAAVYLQQHPLLRPAVTPAAVTWRPVPLLRLLARLAPDALDAGAAEDYAFITDEQLLEVAIVAGGVAASAQLYHPRAFLIADAVWCKAAAVTVHESLRSLVHQTPM
jgi:hypothetical protein